MNWRRFIMALLLLPMLGGCEIEPNLHLRKVVDTKVVLQTSVTVDMMWQVDWQAQWQYAWQPDIHGELGYGMPQSMRLHLYTLGTNGTPKSHNTFNFHGMQGQVDIFEGIHNLLFHNTDSEVLSFHSDDEIWDVEASTRIISRSLKPSSPVKTVEQKSTTTKSDFEEIDEPVAFMPDELFTLYDPNRLITDNLDDYEYIDGKYVLRIHGDLHPASIIYLFQVKLLNNLDRVSGSEGGAVLTGVSRSVSLATGMTSSEKVGVPADVYMNKAVDPDMFGCRVLCFGIPGCNPYDDASVAAAPEGKHWFVLNVCFNTGKYKNIRIDVTDKIRALPLGGVISLEVDVEDFPPEDIDPPIDEGGGFKPLIGNWQEEVGETTITF